MFIPFWPTTISQLTSRLAAISHQPPTFRFDYNWLKSRLVLLITPRRGRHRKHRFQQFYCCVKQLSHGSHREHIFPVSPLVRVRNLLPRNGRCLQSLLSNGSTCYDIYMGLEGKVVLISVLDGVQLIIVQNMGLFHVSP
jgi:hypothetical protein